MPRQHLNIGELYRALNRRREVLGITWANIAEQTGLAAPLFCRLAAGRTVSVDAYLTLLVWLGEPNPLRFSSPEDQ